MTPLVCTLQKQLCTQSPPPKVKPQIVLARAFLHGNLREFLWQFKGIQGNSWGISANRFADSLASPDLASHESFQGSRTEPPFFGESGFGGQKNANRRFEAIRENRSHVMKIGVFLRSDSRESVGHLSCP